MLFVDYIISGGEVIIAVGIVRFFLRSFMRSRAKRVSVTAEENVVYLTIEKMALFLQADNPPIDVRRINDIPSFIGSTFDSFSGELLNA